MIRVISYTRSAANVVIEIAALLFAKNRWTRIQIYRKLGLARRIWFTHEDWLAANLKHNEHSRRFFLVSLHSCPSIRHSQRGHVVLTCESRIQNCRRYGFSQNYFEGFVIVVSARPRTTNRNLRRSRTPRPCSACPCSSTQAESWHISLSCAPHRC
jgi:hypothetical protein